MMIIRKSKVLYQSFSRDGCTAKQNTKILQTIQNDKSDETVCWSHSLPLGADHAYHDANQKIKQHLDFEQTEL